MNACKCGGPGKLYFAWTGDDRRTDGPHGNTVLCDGCAASVLFAVERARPGFPTLAELERDAIGRALELSGGDVTQAARMLGLSRSSLYRRLQQPNDPNASELASLRAMRDAARRNGLPL
jgi:hypothetical protein